MSLFIKQARELYNSTFSTANLKKYSMGRQTKSTKRIAGKAVQHTENQ